MRSSALAAGCLAVLSLCALPAPGRAGAQAQVEHGEYLFRAAGCGGCHTDVDHNGPYLAGGRPLATPFGVFYSPNITPDAVHGIGAWSDADFIRALSEGRAPDGSHYYPVFPYTSYTRMRREDMLALRAFLATVPPVARPNRQHDVPWILRFRVGNWVWKRAFFDPGAFRFDPAKPKAWNRGAYIVTALAHCGECHTPRNWLGARDESRHLAGNPDGPEGDPVPNITPDKETGVGTWTQGELADYLSSGETPDSDFAGDLMAEVIDAGLQYLTRDDILSIVTYLRSIPAIRNQRKPDK